LRLRHEELSVRSGLVAGWAVDRVSGADEGQVPDSAHPHDRQHAEAVDERRRERAAGLGTRWPPHRFHVDTDGCASVVGDGRRIRYDAPTDEGVRFQVGGVVGAFRSVSRARTASTLLIRELSKTPYPRRPLT